MKTSISKLSLDKFANYTGFLSACVLTGASAFVIFYNNPFKIRIAPPPAPLKISLKTFSQPPQKLEQPTLDTPPLPPKLPKPKPIKEHKKEIKHIKKIQKPKRMLEPAPIQTPVAKAEPNITPMPPSPAPSAPVKHVQKHLSMATSANDERFMRILAAIKKYQRYPKQALKMKKTGIVEVGFILKKDGSATDIKLLKSSGVNSLDEAAIKSVQKASKEFTPLDDEYKISIPIAFKIL